MQTYMGYPTCYNASSPFPSYYGNPMPPRGCGAQARNGTRPPTYPRPTYPTTTPQPTPTTLTGAAGEAERHLLNALMLLTQAQASLGSSMQWNDVNQFNTMMGTAMGDGLLTGGDNMLGAIDVMGEKRGVNQAKTLVELAYAEVQSANVVLNGGLMQVQIAQVQDNSTMLLLCCDNIFTNMSERRKLEQSMYNIQCMQRQIGRNLELLRSGVSA